MPRPSTDRSRRLTEPSLAKPVVVTIPGARPKRPWQSIVHRVLEPHFECKGYPYSDYDFLLGPLAIVFDLRWLALAFVAFVAIFFVHLPISLFLLTFMALFVAMAVRSARLKRLDCVERFSAWVAGAGGGRAPHIIADTFGCFLVGAATQAHHEVKIGNVVLASPPLPKKYQWTPIVRGERKRMANVRSEIAQKDLVSLFMYPAGIFTDDLGDAGVSGFDRTKIVHTAPPDGICDDCRLQVGPPASVHNIPLDSRRGRQFRSPAHVQNFWLPFLWNIPIPEFWYMLDAARSITELEDHFDYASMERAIRALLRSRFEWTHKRSLEQWIKAAIATYVARHSDVAISERAIFEYVRNRLPGLMAMAENESFKGGQRNERVVQCLRPKVAIMRLIRKACAG